MASSHLSADLGPNRFLEANLTAACALMQSPPEADPRKYNFRFMYKLLSIADDIHLSCLEALADNPPSLQILAAIEVLRRMCDGIFAPAKEGWRRNAKQEILDQLDELLGVLQTRPWVRSKEKKEE